MKNNDQAPASRESAFTLVELLLVALMVSVLSLTIYATLSKGLDIWKRSIQQDSLEELGIFFEKYSRELKDTFGFSSIPFGGKEDEVSFAALVPTPALQANCIGKIVYRFDKGREELIREEYTYSQVYEQAEGRPRVMVKDVASVTFLYYFYDTTKHEFAWSKEWLQEGLPLAVRVNIELKSLNGSGKYIRTVSIPAGPEKGFR